MKNSKGVKRFMRLMYCDCCGYMSAQHLMYPEGTEPYDHTYPCVMNNCENRGVLRVLPYYFDLKTCDVYYPGGMLKGVLCVTDGIEVYGIAVDKATGEMIKLNSRNTIVWDDERQDKEANKGFPKKGLSENQVIAFNSIRYKK